MVFFTWAGKGLGKAFTLPSSSKLLLILAVVVAIAGIVLATRPGRRFASGKVIPGLRSAGASLRRVAQNPGKMIMLFGGSALITLAYIGALAASVEASPNRSTMHLLILKSNPGGVDWVGDRDQARYGRGHHARVRRPGHRAGLDAPLARRGQRVAHGL